MKAAIILDDWKLSIFRKNLTAAGYEYKDGGAAGPEMTLLTVEYTNIMHLQSVVHSSERECREWNAQRSN